MENDVLDIYQAYLQEDINEDFSWDFCLDDLNFVFWNETTS